MFTVKSNTQFEFEALRIGAGNFERVVCVDGANGRCDSARVQTGQVISVGDYSLHVLDIFSRKRW